MLKQGDDYELGLFHDPSNALFNILVLQTTANFPDIMLPIYKSNRYASLFFVLFLLINNVILLNLTLSVFYLNYKKNFEESLSKETTQEHEARYKFTFESDYYIFYKVLFKTL